MVISTQNVNKICPRNLVVTLLPRTIQHKNYKRLPDQQI